MIDGSQGCNINRILSRYFKEPADLFHYNEDSLHQLQSFYILVKALILSFNWNYNLSPFLVVVLWSYEDLDKRDGIKSAAYGDEVWNETGEDILYNLII